MPPGRVGRRRRGRAEAVRRGTPPRRPAGPARRRSRGRAAPAAAGRVSRCTTASAASSRWMRLVQRCGSVTRPSRTVSSRRVLLTRRTAPRAAAPSRRAAARGRAPRPRRSTRPGPSAGAGVPSRPRAAGRSRLPCTAVDDTSTARSGVVAGRGEGVERPPHPLDVRRAVGLLGPGRAVSATTTNRASQVRQQRRLAGQVDREAAQREPAPGRRRAAAPARRARARPAAGRPPSRGRRSRRGARPRSRPHAYAAGVGARPGARLGAGVGWSLRTSAVVLRSGALGPCATGVVAR